TDRDRDAGDVIALQIDLAGVEARTDLDPERADLLGDRPRAVHAARRAFERREEPIAHRLHLATAMARELGTDDVVVSSAQRAPVSIAQFGAPLRRVDDVGEEHRREYRVQGSEASLSPDE